LSFNAPNARLTSLRLELLGSVDDRDVIED
jgi:hypothetical protein